MVTGLVTTTTTTTDIIVAQAHSDIVCAVVTAASVGVSGRVMTSGGGGIDRATVTLTNPDGEISYALTSTFGYYTFSDVAVGNTYVLQVNHKRYDSQSIVLNLIDEVTDLDFIMSSPASKSPTLFEKLR